jgi:hypothetical protein
MKIRGKKPFERRERERCIKKLFTDLKRRE